LENPKDQLALFLQIKYYEDKRDLPRCYKKQIQLRELSLKTVYTEKKIGSKDFV